MTCNEKKTFFKSLEICAPFPVANPLVGIHMVTSDSAFNSFVRTTAPLLFCQTQTPTCQFADEMLLLSSLTRNNNRCHKVWMIVEYLSDRIRFKHVRLHHITSNGCYCGAESFSYNLELNIARWSVVRISHSQWKKEPLTLKGWIIKITRDRAFL